MTARVELTGVWKAYPRWPEGARTLRAIVARRAPLFARGAEPHWALRDVSLHAGAGEAVGIIGPNGAGKSTLLRLAAGLGRPTRGAVAIDGRRAGVLTLGDTLDPLLTGDENALTALVVAGVPLREARALVPRAIEFGELEAVARTPVRTYSDGMKLRLAFGVVAQLRPQVLLLDEVIAVGDLAFQARCLQRVRELRDGGTTVVFASHDLGLVRSECASALWLEDGFPRGGGAAEGVVDAYEEATRRRAIEQTPAPGPAGDAEELRLRENRVGTLAATIERVHAAAGGSGDPGAVTVSLRAHGDAVIDPILSIAVHGQDGDLRFEANTRDDGVRVGTLDGARAVTLAFERLDLPPGDYLLDVGLYTADWREVLDFHWRAYTLRIAGAGASKGALAPPRQWTLSSP